MPNEGLLLVVAAPSGAGKTSLLAALVERDARLVTSVSFTTRPPRPGEEDGTHYHFVDAAAFRKRLARDEFLEYAEVFGHLYGTHRETTERLLELGRDVILEIDWQGARQVRAAFPACRSIFILPPSLATLRQRLGHRAQDSTEVIAQRMREARSELSHCKEFEFVVVNDDFDQALARLQAVIAACRGGADYRQPPYAALLAELLGTG